MKKINTVLGPIAPEDLGLTLIHEHITAGYPGWECDPLSRPYNREKMVQLALRALQPVKDYGLEVDCRCHTGGFIPGCGDHENGL